MRVNYGQPVLPKMRIDKSKFETNLRRIFEQIRPKEISYLWDLMIEASEQKHGTMVVVSTGAEGEAKRLQKQATGIEPIKLTPQIVKSVTSIDGAVLIDTTSTCYAIGVILDGLASKHGTPSRGARYNSAIRYVETSQYPCIAIVISEDGTIDLIPDLMP
jgi:DNA integrity scanning protein DisA with diadenylate cyclase activity